MKKIISIFLMLTLILGNFIGGVKASALGKNISNAGEMGNINLKDTSKRVLDIYKENKDKKKFKNDEILVKLKNNIDKDYIKIIENKYDLNIKKDLGNGLILIKFNVKKYNLDDILSILNNDTNIEFSEPDYLLEKNSSPISEPDYSKQWGLKNVLVKGIDVNIEPAWNVTYGNPEAVVGIIDSGIDYNHPDLKNNIWINYSEIPYNSIDDDNNGYIDDYYGWDFYNSDNNPYDDNNHGTHVSGIIAASSNGTGIAGVAPNVKLMALKVANSAGQLYSSDEIEAINYGLKKGVKIFNCSFGNTAYSFSEYSTIMNANALFICAAGNEGENNDIYSCYPCGYELENIISVASIDEYGELSYFSNYGAKTVDIAAPGSNIYSTISNGGYGYLSGTSMATPFVTGAAAILLSGKRDITISDMRKYILGSTHSLQQLSNKVATNSILDVSGTLVSLKPDAAINVTGVTLDKTSLSLTKGQNLRITANVLPNNATNNWITWTSTDANVATVDFSGKVVGVGEGNATITANTVDGQKTATCSVNVSLPPKQLYYPGNKFIYKIYTPQILGEDGLVYFIKPDGTEENFLLKANPKDGYYYVELGVNDDDYIYSWEIDSVKDFGTWEVKYIAISDLVSGYKYYYNKKYYSINNGKYNTMDFDANKFTVVGYDGVIKDDTEDLTNNSMVPTPNNITVFNKIEIDRSELYPGNKAMLKIYSKDTSGIDDGLIYLIKPNGTEKSYLLKSNPRGGYYYTQLGVNNDDYIYSWEIDPAVDSGNWEVKSVVLYDVNGNSTRYYNQKYYSTNPVNFDAGSFNVYNEAKSVTGITLNKQKATLNKSESLQLSAQVEPEDASNKEIIWSSSNPAIASVNDYGIVNTFGVGTATITATTVDGNFTASCDITVVNPVTGLSLDKSSISMEYGASITLIAKVVPDDASDKSVNWSTSNASVAIVDKSGKVTGVGEGSAVITAKTSDGGFTATCSVTVSKPVISVTLNKTDAIINKGSNLQLAATVLPETLTNKSVTWSSSNPSVAIVDNKGLVTALEKGTAVITVKTVEGGKTAQCTITVTANSVINKIRYGGLSRFSTAVEVSKAGWTTSENVILVNAYGFADALTGVPIAQIKNAPILLTNPDSLSGDTNNEIIRLKVKNIYVLGGVGVVSKGIEDNLKSRGYNVYRIAGNDRFETAMAIGEQVIKAGGTKTAILTTAYNYPDALAISSYAAINKFPILYTNPVSFTDSTRNFILQNGITKVIIPGGTGAVSSAIESELKSRGINVQRIAGADRYSTAFNIVNTFKASFKNDVMLATGANFPDALAGGALAAKMQIPILLVEQNRINPDSEAFIRSKGSVNLYILGGSGVISDDIIK